MDNEILPDDINLDEETNTISSSSLYSHTHRGLGYEYFKRMQQNKDKIAQYIADTGETDTYRDFLSRSIRTALHLKTKNLSKNDVVCLCSYNQKHNCIPLIACTFLGIPTASLDPSFTINDASHLIKLIKPKIFFIVPEVIDLITESIRIAGLDHCEVVLYGEDVDTERFTPFDYFLAEHPEEDAFRPVIIEDVSETAIIFFSSGTTGLPKGICSSHKAIYHQGAIMNHLGILGNDAVVLLFSTLYWISAVLTLTGCILKGSARLVCKEFDPRKTWHLLDKYKITYAFLAPIQAYRMLKEGRPDGIDTSSLNLVVTGGAHFATEPLHEFRDLLPGTFVCQGYGCTELSGFGVAFNLTKTKDRLLLHYRPESCGRPIPGLHYKVVDPDSENRCRFNERGELRIKSDCVMTGYYSQNADAAFDGEGWLRTGDVVFYDEDFCFYVVDRIKEMLKFRSWHVPPAALEVVLQAHPAVKQCTVIGIPDEVDGDLPLAVIVLNDNYAGSVSEEDIEEFVAERVNDTHKLRGGVKFLESLPVTPSGKVKKKEIRDLVLGGSI